MHPPSHNSNEELPVGLLGILKDLWPFLSPEGLQLENDPTSNDALQALIKDEALYCNEQWAVSSVLQSDESTSDYGLLLESVPELSDGESLSGSGK
jgi:hypothetical protein